MKPDDPVLHEQLHHICSNARKAVAADRCVLIIEFHDEDKDKPCTMLMYDGPQENKATEEAAHVVMALLAGVNSILLSTTKLQVAIKNNETGEVRDIDSFEPHMLDIEI